MLVISQCARGNQDEIADALNEILDSQFAIIFIKITW